LRRFRGCRPAGTRPASRVAGVDGELDSAIKGAAKRTLGEAWAWSRKSSDVDISPLVSVTLAFWGITKIGTGAGGFEW
jgi:hypothetical protein